VGIVCKNKGQGVLFSKCGLPKTELIVPLVIPNNTNSGVDSKGFPQLQFGQILRVLQIVGAKMSLGRNLKILVNCIVVQITIADPVSWLQWLKASNEVYQSEIICPSPITSR
jgi:hypothetical protein